MHKELNNPDLYIISHMKTNFPQHVINLSSIIIILFLLLNLSNPIIVESYSESDKLFNEKQETTKMTFRNSDKTINIIQDEIIKMDATWNAKQNIIFNESCSSDLDYYLGCNIEIMEMKNRPMKF